jgi:transposase
VVEAIRHLLVVPAGAIKSRTAAVNQFDKLLITAPAGAGEPHRPRTGRHSNPSRRLAPATDRLRDPAQSATYALRSLARRIHDLTTEAADLEQQLAVLVQCAAPRTPALLGVGPIHTAQMLTTAGENITRLRGETAFAPACTSLGALPKECLKRTSCGVSNGYIAREVYHTLRADLKDLARAT